MAKQKRLIETRFHTVIHVQPVTLNSSPSCFCQRVPSCASGTTQKERDKIQKKTLQKRIYSDFKLCLAKHCVRRWREPLTVETFKEDTLDHSDYRK